MKRTIGILLLLALLAALLCGTTLAADKRTDSCTVDGITYTLEVSYAKCYGKPDLVDDHKSDALEIEIESFQITHDAGKINAGTVQFAIRYRCNFKGCYTSDAHSYAPLYNSDKTIPWSVEDCTVTTIYTKTEENHDSGGHSWGPYFRITITRAAQSHDWEATGKCRNCEQTCKHPKISNKCIGGICLDCHMNVTGLGHDTAIDAAVAATCTKTGLTEGKHCKRAGCGMTLVAQNVTSTLGHDPAIDAAVAATCTETGLTEGSHCKREGCGEVFAAQTVTAALGHTFGAYVSNGDATYWADGTKTAHCIRCSVTDTVTDKGSQRSLAPILSVIASGAPFDDVDSSDWFCDDVAYVLENGLMTGTAAGRFDPYAPVTRGMVLTVLARRNGIKTDLYTPWYAAGCDWAKQAGISDGTNPTAPITREQLAVMLYRAAQKQSRRTEGRVNALNGFSDASSASAYAREALRWAVSEGILTGSGSTLAPKRGASRAELAAILHRYFG